VSVGEIRQRPIRATAFSARSLWVTEPVSKARRKAAVGFIFATALMDIVAMGIMIPVLPNLVKSFVGGDTARAADYTMIFAVTWGLMQFFASPVMGMLSDRFGRRPVLLISIFGLGVDYMFMALAPTLGWLYVGRLINGVTSASFSTANAYIADVTEPENRAKAFGLMGAAFGIGFVVGPAIGGWLGAMSLRLPFYVSAGLAMINWAYGWFILPESLPPERRATTLNWSRANPVGSLNLLLSKPGLIWLSAVYVLFQLAHNVFPSIFVLFVGHRFGWGPDKASYLLVATGVVSIIVQGALVGRAVKLLKERGSLLVGLASAALSFLVYALAPNAVVIYLGLLVGALGGLIGPGLQGLMTRRVGPAEQGRLQGANSAIMGISAIIGPALYLSLLSFEVRHEATLHLPGLPFLAAAGLCGLALLVAWKVAHPIATADPAGPASS
jgi:DHA1 family tetracycline resistance protein-like MFS transporter